MNINLTITADTPEELAHALKALASFYGKDRIAGASYGDEEQTTALVTVADEAVSAVTAAPPKRRARGTAAPDTTTAEPVDAAPEVEAAPTTSKTPVNHVEDLSPDKAREEGIRVLQKHFANNPNDMKAIQQLQSKYGVRAFSEIADDQCHHFLTDAKLVEAGSFTMAA